MSARILRLTYGTSRARDTEGWQLVTLTDGTTGKRYRAMGGGYDLAGTVFSDWLEAAHADALARIAPDRADCVRTDKRTLTYSRPDGATGRPMSGLTWCPDTGRASLDGGCGLESMIAIAEAVGLEVKRLASPRGRLLGFVVTGGAA